MMNIPVLTEWRKSTRSTAASNCVEIAWRKSTRSSTQSNCVELAWHKSSLSGSGSNCVEVAFTSPVAVRDSKNAPGPTLTFPPTTWSTFVSALH